MRKISQRCIDLVKRFEGCELKAYICAAGALTIGYGHTGPDVTQGLVITKARAEELLQADLDRFSAGVRNITGDTTQGQFDALVSFAYNVGLGNLMKSTLLKKHKAGDHRGAAAEFGKWINGGGRKLNGLVKRRAAERTEYLS